MPAAVRSSSGRRSTATAVWSFAADVRSANSAAALGTLECLGLLRVLALEGLH